MNASSAGIDNSPFKNDYEIEHNKELLYNDINYSSSLHYF